MIRQKLMALIARERLDALIYPEQKRLVVKIGETDQAGRTRILAAVTGFPTIAVPAGFSNRQLTPNLACPSHGHSRRALSEALLRSMANAFEQNAKARPLP